MQDLNLHSTWVQALLNELCSITSLAKTKTLRILNNDFQEISNFLTISKKFIFLKFTLMTMDKPPNT